MIKPNNKRVLKPLYRDQENHSLYEGEWIDCNKDRLGVYIDANGSRYDGFWKENQKYGNGRFVSVTGLIYEGSWENDVEHGFGKMSLHDLTIY